MGNKSTKSSLKNAIVILSISADTIQANDDKFWEQIWVEDATKAAEIIKSIRTQEIRMLRDGSPKNFAILAYKMIERLSAATGTLCNTPSQQTAVINASRILIRILPCVFEDRAWRQFFIENHIEPASESNPLTGPKLSFPSKTDQERDYTSYLPHRTSSRPLESSPGSDLQEQVPEIQEADTTVNDRKILDTDSLLRSLVLSICDLLFCPEFTVPSHSHGYLLSSVDGPPEDLKSLATCDYVWEPGVGFDSNVNSTTYYDKSRSVLLRLLLTFLSSTLYETASSCVSHRNHWIEVLVSTENRHALPLFTSLLNIIFSYSPAKSIPFNHFFFEDSREELVELAVQILISTLDYSGGGGGMTPPTRDNKNETNLFIEYISRIHRGEDFTFIVKGMTRLLNNRLEQQGYLMNSGKQISFEQELLILNWKLCNLNKRYISHLLKTNDVLDIVIPILHHLNENFQDSSKSALIHIGAFNLLILSGERNFGVRLNKPYLTNTLVVLPNFTGSHADLMIIVFHKLILYGYDLNQLFDFLLTIIVNISPYLKTLSMLAGNCLIHLFEIFSSPAVVFTEPNYHQLVIFLLEIFNNIIQYQFDGNANLIYSIMNRKEIFLNLANMPTSQASIQKVLRRLIKIKHDHLEKFGTMPNELGSGGGGNAGATDSAKGPAGKANDAAAAAADMMRGISLLATPDICDVTHPTNPNQESASKQESADRTSPKLLDRQDSNEDKNQLSLDDILNYQAQEEETPMISMDEIKPKQPDHCLDSLIALERDASQKDSIHESVGENPATPDIDAESTSGASTTNDTTAITKTANKEQPPIRVWRPTSKWLKQWKQSLPLQTILRMIEVLVPQVDRVIKENNSSGSNQRDEPEIIKFLQNGTLVGLLPVPHPILIRKYHTNEETTLWFRVCSWGVIYHRNPIWSDTEVKLIKLIQ